MQKELKELKISPAFDQFKQFLREAVIEITGTDVKDNSRWLEIGDEDKRANILQALKSSVEREYGVELLLPANMEMADTFFESVATQLHHVFNTVYLMERINHKIMKRRYTC